MYSLLHAITTNELIFLSLGTSRSFLWFCVWHALVRLSVCFGQLKVSKVYFLVCGLPKCGWK